MSTPGFRPDTIDGRKATQAECDRLHFLKNRPDVPQIDGMPIDFPPYEYRPYPAAMYGHWNDTTRLELTRQIAVRLGLNMSLSDDRAIAESKLPEFDSRIVHNDAERADWLNKGWADEPGQVKSAQQRLDEAVAQAAAERAFTDRRMSQEAKAEFHAADVANGDEHLIDLPAPRKKPGRPKKELSHVG